MFNLSAVSKQRCQFLAPRFISSENNKSLRMWKKAVAAYLQLPSWRFPQRIQRIKKKGSQNSQFPCLNQGRQPQDMELRSSISRHFLLTALLVTMYQSIFYSTLFITGVKRCYLF
jgi:hypothetical protein